MNVTELSFKVYLTKNIAANEMMRKIAEIIDIALGKSEKHLDFHNKKTYKGYVFDGFYRVETDGIYKEGKIYTFRLRTIDNDLADYFEQHLVTAYTKYIKVLTVNNRIIPKKHIEKIYSLTPVLIKTDEGYWRTHMSIDEYEKRIRENLIKNYNYITEEKLDENFEFFVNLKFDNMKPIAIPYKDNINLLGDKITVYISENIAAQELAYFALAAGLGENSARGCGFCGYKYLQ